MSHGLLADSSMWKEVERGEEKETLIDCLSHV
jgi:hypothetical protein